eukprot:6210026-Pleurochrysis_carterae.AAC.2
MKPHSENVRWHMPRSKGEKLAHARVRRSTCLHSAARLRARLPSRASAASSRSHRAAARGRRAARGQHERRCAP